MNESINDKGACRTAPATLRLLIPHFIYQMHPLSHGFVCLHLFHISPGWYEFTPPNRDPNLRQFPLFFGRGGGGGGGAS